MEKIKDNDFTAIVADLKDRGEHSITFRENGIITSRHGKSTLNYWIVQDGELKCIDCKTIYSLRRRHII